MQQTLVWKPWCTPGVETLRLSQDANGILATSHLMQVIKGNSIVANYMIECDPRWRFRRLWLKVDNQGQRNLCLQRDETQKKKIRGKGKKRKKRKQTKNKTRKGGRKSKEKEK